MDLLSPQRAARLSDKGPHVLDREEEQRQARRLAEAREAFAATLLALPGELRARVLAGEEEGPLRPRRWPVARVEECHLRLQGLAALESDRRVLRLVERARRHRATIHETRDALVLANLGLVSHVARQFDAPRLPYVDLFQEGTLGLLAAVERFEWERGYKFSTYAYWWIRQAISSAVAEDSTFLRMSDHSRAKLRRCQRVASEVGASLAWHPDWSGVARRTGVPAHKLEELIRVAREPYSLEAASAEEDDDQLRQIPDPGAPDPLERALERERRERLAAALGDLDPREKTILTRRFGIDDGPTCTLEQIGRMLKLTRERVRQIEQMALRKMQLTTPPNA